MNKKRQPQNLMRRNIRLITPYTENKSYFLVILQFNCERLLMKTILKIISGTLFLFTSVSCNNVLDRSIIEPLTPKELNETIKEYPDFAFTYKFVEIRNKYLQTTSQKAMWHDLTYKRLHKFLNKILDEDFHELYTKKFGQKWELQYGHYKASADSVCKIWQNYWDTHKATNYVRVDLIDIEKEYLEPIWGGEPIVSSKKFVFKVTPLRGTVDAISFDYDLFEKDEKPSFSDFLSHYHSVDIDKPFSAPIVVKDTPTVKFEVDETIKSSDFKTVLNKYKFAFAINYVIINGKKVSNLELRKATPDAVYEYMVNKDNEKASDFEKEWPLTRIIEDILGKEYESKDDYISKQMFRIYSEIDELAFRFYSPNVPPKF